MALKIELDLIQRFIKDYSTLSKSGKTIVLCWIPSHVGIFGNKKVDTAARSAFSLHVTAMNIPAADLVPCVTKLISEKRQHFWNSWTGNKLQAIRPTVSGHQQKSSLYCQYEVITNRLRIGPTRCTHSYLLSGATSLSARLVSVHSLSSTSLLSVLILTILAINILSLLFWRNCLELLTYVTSLILSTTSYC